MLAGNDIPVGVCIRCLLDCIRNAKQHLGLALIGAARQKQCQTDNGKASFPASQKSYQNKVSHGCAIITPSAIAGTSRRIDQNAPVVEDTLFKDRPPKDARYAQGVRYEGLT